MDNSLMHWELDRQWVDMRVGLCIQKGGHREILEKLSPKHQDSFILLLLLMASLGCRYDTENIPMAFLPLQRTAKNRRAIRDRQRDASNLASDSRRLASAYAPTL